MGLHVSIAKHIADLLKRAGYRPRQWRRGALGNRVYEKNGTAVVVIPVIEIPPVAIQPVKISIDDYFDNLRRLLAGLMKKLKVCDLFFTGGGTIPVPPWFEQWCEENGIRIHILDPESGPKDIREICNY